MKKLFIFLLVFTGFMACENEIIQELPQEQETFLTDGVTARNNLKVNVCHKGKIINVSVKALSGHQGHGDAVDMDSDGYFDLVNDCSEVDCDDTNPDVSPAMEEICDDGIDNNCDGLTDNEDPICIEIGDCRDGGVVFYLADDNEDLNGDGIPDLGLLVALENQGAKPWNNGTSFEIGANNYDLGTGFTNTNAIIAAQGPVETDYAAGLARLYEGGGYTDWFLPSGAEIFELFKAINIVNPAIIDCGGTEITGTYWTSTEEGDDDATDTSFTSGLQTTTFKGTAFYVRAVRVF
jgi:hypothetical protein